MDRLQKAILENIKTGYFAGKRFQVPSNPNSGRAYYLANINDNLFEKMSAKTRKAYVGGNGKELEGKMCALRSSSAMTFNLLGNNPVSFSGDNRIAKGTYSNTFEVPFYTLKREVSNHPANLDAYMECGKEAIACEMKMMEWFSSPGKLKEAYTNPDNYDIPKTEATKFVSFAQSLMEDRTKADSDKFACKFNNYDAFQMFKHTLALFTACKKGEIKPERLTLVNCVWELSDTKFLSDKDKSRYDKLHTKEISEFAHFKAEAKPIIELFKSAFNIDFDIEYYSMRDFAALIDMRDARRKYLERYI